MSRKHSSTVPNSFLPPGTELRVPYSNLGSAQEHAMELTNTKTVCLNRQTERIQQEPSNSEAPTVGTEQYRSVFTPAVPDNQTSANRSRSNRIETAPSTQIDSLSKVIDNSTTYSDETIRLLLRSMQECGYNDHRRQTKTRREYFSKVVDHASTKYGVRRTTDGWERKFDRMKKAYSKYIRLISNSGRDGDDPNLFNKPPFFTELHELEKSNARHSPPATLCTELELNTTSEGKTPTSTRKRARHQTSTSLLELEKIAAERHEAIHNQLVAANAERKRFNDLFAEFLRKKHQN